MEVAEIKKNIEKILDDNKAQSITSINLKNKSYIADYMVIASGTSSRHLQSLSETSAIKLLKSARSSVTKLERYFATINLNILDDHGKPIYHAKDLIANLANMGKVVNGLEELEEIVKKHEQKDNPNRGGVVTNKYSQ